MTVADIAAAASELKTVRDLVRFGLSRFTKADIAFGHGTTSPLDEAAFMVLEALSLPIDELAPWLDARLTLAERERIVGLIDQRIVTRKPASYLLNKAYIQGIPFYVDERVIVPRSFIGELMMGDMFGGDGFNLIEDAEAVETVLDLCTGSGCLAILAAHIFPNAMIDAVDLSADALAVARINVDASEFAHRINLHQGDLFAPLAGTRYDLIITNPPYVAADEVAELPAEYLHEPVMALGSGVDGLDITRRILAAAPDHLTANGGLICEIGTGQDILVADYPEFDFLWLDTEESVGEVFWLKADAFGGPRKRPSRKR
ncbi:MAG: 50S ribosomal protein L3 N(5)-glutamine methyltransferase [Hyphomicrobiaceae bacterium]|nr:50S ribosomal protein L3 N(5)-glutamine methyltransferase [Hyphomicrobiaceae bacterium]